MKLYEKEILRKLNYNPESGKIFWKYVVEETPSDKTYNKRFAGNLAGSIKTSKNKEGYREIHICGKMVKAHRVAWFLYYGVWPEMEIDHINHVRDDNRIKNLREVDRGRQNRNSFRRKDNSSGCTGVYFNKRCAKWAASIQCNKIRKFLGYFETKDLAITARNNAKNKLDFSETHGDVND